MAFVEDGLRMASGRTQPGATNWQVYSPTGIYVDVDITSARFTGTPVIVTSIGGAGNHWATTGASAIYPVPPDLLATATRFRVYLRWVDNSPLTPAQANAFKWHINWVGMEV
ncbi:MAG: hypothetical protein JST22_19475 [Bacteroidetes bacterium]|nr:hypothetical protein [Bacteroidota bacterium]